MILRSQQLLCPVMSGNQLKERLIFVLKLQLVYTIHVAVGGESDKTSLEYQVQIKELKDMIMVFLSQGFTKEETQSTLLDMANYRHLREEIIRLVEEA